MSLKTRAAVLAAGVLATGGCGDRAELWSQPPASPSVFGLGHSVAIVDAPAHRVVALSAGEGQSLISARLPTGRGVVAAVPAADGSALYVLAAGYRPGLGDTRPFEAPTLTVIADGRPDGTPAGVPPSATTIDLGSKLSDPLSGLAVDPEGKWAVLYAGPNAGNAFVTNPNELVIVELATKKIDVVSLHSFGGRPERLIFTGPLALPGGDGHLLLVQSQQDLSILRLEEPTTPEITVRLADAASTRVPAPAQVVVDAGGPAVAGGAAANPVRIGLRFQGDSAVMTLQLDAASGALGFAPSVNVADAGGIPTDLAFVRTDGGLRLAALVPSGNRAVLIDPVTSVSTDVALPAPYQRLSLVTDPAATADVALLWQGSGARTGVAFWELGQAAGRPFRSIETVGVDAMVSAVLDVPLPGTALKVLATAQQGAFYVLDLDTRTAAPLLTTSSEIALTMSPTGRRVWTFVRTGRELATTDIATKHARTLRADSPISAVFEIGRADAAGAAAGARSLIALHASGGFGATIYDVATADDRGRRIYGGLLTEGPYDDQ